MIWFKLDIELHNSCSHVLFSTQQWRYEVLEPLRNIHFQHSPNGESTSKSAQRKQMEMEQTSKLKVTVRKKPIGAFWRVRTFQNSLNIVHMLVQTKQEGQGDPAQGADRRG